MPKIKITNPRNVIEAPIKKNYFKIRATSGPKGDKGDTGATGPQGPQGPQGNAATIYVGSTTTLPVGQDATVENVGSQYAAVLNFGIPQGPQGPQGAKGDKGDKGDKGEQGNTGNTGPAGQNATVYIGTTTTGAPGSQASVYNSGTENNAVLNFTIPQGQKGDTGATGATGPQGPAGQDGKDFSPSVVDSLPAVGEENKLYLTPKAHTTQTATGNPITATITDGAGQIEDFRLDGDTYQQSYEGWNIIDVDFESVTSYGVTKTLNADKTITLNGKINAGLNFTFGKDITFDTNSQYTLKVEVLRGSSTPYANDGLPNHQWAVMVNMGLSSQGWQSYAVMCADDVTTVTFTPAKSTGQPRFWFGYNASTADETTGIFNDYTLRISVKKGTTISGYEPYVGGQPSPSPAYPQQIQTVTGTQTVAINGTNYPLDLGTIELCKLGTYQDYIYKDGDTWKVHKAVAKHALTPNEGWLIPNSASYPNLFQTNAISGLGNLSDAYTTASTSPQAYCEALVYLPGSSGVRTTQGFTLYHTVEGGMAYNIARINIAGFTTTNQLNNWLSTCNASFWYGVKNPTDTAITDQTLIAQLNAIASASLENGSNTITNTATGSNLAGDMEVDYFGYDPTNRYDKWLWLDINNAYEKLGS